nr:MAG TPA: baseplate component [Caudoviricetes sp.]
MVRAFCLPSWPTIRKIRTECDFMIDLNLRTPNVERQGELDARAAAIKMRVCVPGIIQSFDVAAQTVTVQPALREKMLADGDESWIDIPLLVDVPIVVPRAGGYALTLPIQAGDECLVVFGDMCMDGWWQSGGVQNQVECRRHDLSDGFAIIGVWSQPRVIPGYSTGSAQLRNDAGSAYVELAGDTINIVGGTVNIKAGRVNINE